MILEDDVTRGRDGVLPGLIANNFVRVYHPVAFGNGPGCNNTGDTGGRTIDAAILALKHSFINDNWYCGSPTGNLTVVGAISQKFRGPVGTGTGTTIVTGYFLDPVQSWRIARETEQVPAVKPSP